MYKHDKYKHDKYKHDKHDKYNTYIKFSCYLSDQFPTPQLGGKYKWDTLTHNGVLFAPPYEKHNIPVIYKNKEIILPEDAEEYATIYTKYLDTEYIKDKTFNKNFWHDWRHILGKDHAIQDLENCDFSRIQNYMLEHKEKITRQRKESINQLQQIEEPYKHAFVDGKKQQVGNFRIEPPSLFLGRGCNPNLGRIKYRIHPEDITINIGKDASIPIPSYIMYTNSKPHLKEITNATWGNIIHDKNVEWLDSWKDDITGKTKYVWLGSQSDLRAQGDMQKFDLARKLKKKIRQIRQAMEKDLNSIDIKLRQIATAVYLVDKLALRIGNEKYEDEADTVGVVTLRPEHIYIDPNVTEITLDFLGKDSVRYKRTIKIDKHVYENLQEFSANKTNNENIFDEINAQDVNKYLQSFMKGLTAKVFRTYKASFLFQRELEKNASKYLHSDEDNRTNLLLDEFNKANAVVAYVCNHQKNISKSFNEQIKKITSTIKKLRSKITKATTGKRIEKLREQIKKLKIKRDMKISLKNLSLGTSKVNYIDPRVTVAFMKKYNIPIDKLFTKTLQDKFKWAFDVDSNWRF